MGIKIDGVEIPLGVPSIGVIKGGTVGQALIKKTGANYDTEWGIPDIPLATEETKGTVKSSTGTDKVTVAQDGTMSVSTVSVAETALDASNAESANYALEAAKLSPSSYFTRQNILDNTNMFNPINQMGNLTYSQANTNNIFIDRWNWYGGGIATAYLENAGLRFLATQPWLGMRQFTEGSRFNVGETYCYSVLFKNESNFTITVSAHLGAYEELGGTLTQMVPVQSINLAANQSVLITRTFICDKKYSRFVFVAQRGSNTIENATFRILGIKCEIGNFQTLAYKDESGNWHLLDSPPNYEQEFAKCQRYMQLNCRNIVIGQSYNKSIWFTFPIVSSLRAIPSVKIISNSTLSVPYSSYTSRASDIVSCSVIGFYLNSLYLMVTYNTFTPGTNSYTVDFHCNLDANISAAI